MNKSPQQRTDEALDGLAFSRSLELKVARSGSDMEISWNRSSDVISIANGGTLTIRDGPIVRVVALSSDQLREGHIWFAPLPGSDLDLRLEVVRRGWKNAGRVGSGFELGAYLAGDNRCEDPAARGTLEGEERRTRSGKQPASPASQDPSFA